jgi:hypothetical protein
MAKGKMKDREFHAVQDIRRHSTEIWNDLTCEEVQSVFLEWKIRLKWVSENGGEYYSEPNKKSKNLFGSHYQGVLSARLSGHPIDTHSPVRRGLLSISALSGSESG